MGPELAILGVIAFSLLCAGVVSAMEALDHKELERGKQERMVPSLGTMPGEQLDILPTGRVSKQTTSLNIDVPTIPRNEVPIDLALLPRDEEGVQHDEQTYRHDTWPEQQSEHYVDMHVVPFLHVTASEMPFEFEKSVQPKDEWSWSAEYEVLESGYLLERSATEAGNEIDWRDVDPAPLMETSLVDEVLEEIVMDFNPDEPKTDSVEKVIGDFASAPSRFMTRRRTRIRGATRVEPDPESQLDFSLAFEDEHMTSRPIE